MTNNNEVNHGRRSFLKAGAAAGVTSLVGCGGGSEDETPNHSKYGFYLGQPDTESLRKLAVFENVVVHPNYVTSNVAKAVGIQRPIAYGSLIAIEGNAINKEAVHLHAQASKNGWLMKNKNGFDIKIPGSNDYTSSSVVDIRIPEAYDAMKKYLTSLVDAGVDAGGYSGVYLNGFDRAVWLNNLNEANLTEPAVRLMGEVADYVQKRGKNVIVAGTFDKPLAGGINPLAEAMMVADVTTVPQIFTSATDMDYLATTQRASETAARSAALIAAAKASGKKDVEIVGVEMSMKPAEIQCATQANYDTLTKDTNIHYSLYFDRPLLDMPSTPPGPRFGDYTHLNLRKVELTREEIIPANAALVVQDKCAAR